MQQGLNTHEVGELREKYGRNEILHASYSIYTIFFRQLYSPLVYLLFFAVIASLLLGDVLNAVIIFGIIMLNATLGFFQEFRAERTLRALQAKVTLHTRVRRNNVEIDIESVYLVPGDILLLQSGDELPADVVFLESDALNIDESLLTGESVPVAKEQSQLGFLGTVVVSGTAQARVVAIGAHTSFGRMSSLTLSTVQESMFHKNISRLSNFLIIVTLIMIGVLVFLHILIKPDQIPLSELLLFAVALAISIMPEALPLVTSFALSHGAYMLARHQVIVKRLSAIEDLGDITVLCCDKTGTLTENILTVASIYSVDAASPQFFAALGNSGAIHGFEAAIFAYLTPEEHALAKNFTILEDAPSSLVLRSKSRTLKNRSTGEIFSITQGALENILGLCKDTSKEVESAVVQWAQEKGLSGQRVIAVAQNNRLLGALAFEDPIKKSTFQAILHARQLGITIKIITGDSPDVAGAVAHAIGLIPNMHDVITGEQFEKLSEIEKQKTLESSSVFARILPEQKYMLVSLLKAQHAVGFLGDGINDAPALKLAHVGIVVNDAADIAKEAADIILLKKNLAVIVNGIYLGRQVFANTSKYITTSLSSNFSNFTTIGIASLFLPFLPLLPLQILLVNLLSDLPMTSIATDTVDAQDLKKPAEYSFSHIARKAIFFGSIGSMSDIIFFGVFYTHAARFVQTAWFIYNTLSAHFLIFALRTRRFFLHATRPSGILVIMTGLCMSAVLILPFTHTGQVVFSFVPIPLVNCLFLVFMLLVYGAAIELAKFFI